MATSVFFNNYDSSQEQNLLDELVAESVRVYGMDMYYIPRTLINTDDIFNESSIVHYNSAISVEMYVKSVEGFSGDGTFLSKFGLEIRDKVIFSIARRTFEDEVEAYNNDLTRPFEGDLIYFPLNNKVFQIKFVDDKPFFYQLGKLQMYDLTCELFEYSGERMNTGISQVDSLEKNHSMNMLSYAIQAETDYVVVDEYGNVLVTEKFDTDEAEDMINDNDEFQAEANTFIDFSVFDPFSEGRL